MAGGRFSVKAIFRAVDRFSVPVSRMSRSVGAFSKKARRGLRSVDAANMKMMRGLSRAGGVMAAGAAVGAAAIIKTGSEFEQAITNVGAVTQKSRAQIQQLEIQALSLGASTKFTATEVADGMEIMARAGFKNGEIMAGIPGILNAAAASGLELAEVSNHVSNVLKGMGLETSDAAKVADVLALASSKTNSSIGTLGESMKNVSSTARQLGVPLESVVASVALLQDVGLDASVAGSALNTMLTKLADPPKEIAAKMDKMGLSFKRSNGDMKDFGEVLATISPLAKGAGGNMNQVQILAKLVGLRGQKAATNLAKLFESGKVKSLTKELENAKGTAEKMANLRLDSVRGQWTLLKSAIDGVVTAVFNSESGQLKDFITQMKDAIPSGRELQLAVREFQESLPGIMKWFKRIGTAVGIFIAFTAAVKATSAAIWVTGAVSTLVGGLVEGYTAIMVAHEGKTILATAATKLWNGMLWLSIGMTKKTTFATMWATTVTWFNVAATKAATFAKGAWAFATGGVTTALGLMTTATGGASGAAVAFNVALGPLLATLGAIAFAAAAAFALVSQVNQLNAETEGLGMTGIAGGMIDQFKEGGFSALDAGKVVDDHQNATAKARAAEGSRDTASQKAITQDRGSQDAFQAMMANMPPGMMSGEITIADQTGLAEITKQMTAGGKLKLQKSGAN